jgi:hypothetical protein
MVIVTKCGVSTGEVPNPDKPEPNREKKRWKVAQQDGTKGTYTSPRLGISLDTRLAQKVATFHQEYCSTLLSRIEKK